ncbi:hypothetical protein D3C80_403690 [compost metagenome]
MAPSVGVVHAYLEVVVFANQTSPKAVSAKGVSSHRVTNLRPQTKITVLYQRIILGECPAYFAGQRSNGKGSLKSHMLDGNGSSAARSIECQSNP